MDQGRSTSLELAKQQFSSLLSELSPVESKDLLDWIVEQYASLKSHTIEDAQVSLSSAFQQCTRAEEALRSIIEDLRTSLPLSGICSSEKMYLPETGQNSDCDPETTIVIDAFLYDDDDIDNLCNENKLSRNYCRDCGSHKTSPLTFISHSMSVLQMKFIFQAVLPKLLTNARNITLVDVGSRLGSVLYGAHYFSKFEQIIGVEMNTELCHIQNEIIQKYGLGNRVQIICDDICNRSEILHQADVIILNNTFEFFLAKETQISTWKNMRANICRTGCILITVPSIEESVCLGIDNQSIVDTESWLVALHVDPTQLSLDYSEDEMEELDKINIYKVK